MEKTEYRGLIAFLNVQESEKNNPNNQKQVIFYLATGKIHGKYLTYDSDEGYVKIKFEKIDEFFIPFSSILAWGNGQY